MARYNTAPQTLTVNGAIEFGYAFTGGIISLTGTTGYTVTLVSPVFFPGSKQTFYNATDGMITIETVAGQIKGNGVALGTDIQIPQNSTYTLTSDGADYVLTSALAGTTTFELPVNFNNLLNADGKVELNPADNNVEIKPTGTGLVDISPQSSVSIQPGQQVTIRPVGNLTLASSTGSISLGEAGKPTAFPGNLDFTAAAQTINMSPTGATSAVTIDPGGDTTIGAGGGSIAWVDKGGLLNIGPESAGSDPGPVSYGLGNDRPTVTDANVVLGRIDPENPMGGKLERLDVIAAQKAIDEHVGVPLGLDTLEAAEAILKVTNSRMAGAIRLVSIERGFDPKRFAFMPFGGGGALHAGAMLAEVGISCAIVPRYPGVTSAMGCVIADMRQDFVQTINTLVSNFDQKTVGSFMQRHKDDGMALLDAARTTFEARRVDFELDMAYVGQTHTVSVPLTVQVVEGKVKPPTKAEIDVAFDVAYQATFGRLLKAGTRRIINLRSAVTGKRPKFDLLTLAPATTGEVTPKAMRLVHFGSDWHKTNIYERLGLPIGTVIQGPAILEQPDTTVLIEPNLQGRVDDFGNTIIEPTEGR